MSAWQMRCPTLGCAVDVWPGLICPSCGAHTVPLFEGMEPRPGLPVVVPPPRPVRRLDVPDTVVPRRVARRRVA